jgi:hypothetical protein
MNKASGSEFTINFRVGALKTFGTKILLVFCAVKGRFYEWMILTGSHISKITDTFPEVPSY